MFWKFWMLFRQPPRPAGNHLIATRIPPGPEYDDGRHDHANAGNAYGSVSQVDNTSSIASDNTL